MTCVSFPGLDRVDRTFATVDELIQFGNAVGKHYLDRIKEWGTDTDDQCPISTLTTWYDGAFDDLDTLSQECQAALHRIRSVAGSVQEPSEPPSVALLETVTGTLSELLQHIRQYFWNGVHDQFRSALENSEDVILDNNTIVGYPFQLAAKDIVQATLIIEFLQQVGEPSVRAPGSSSELEKANQNALVAH